MKNITHWKSHSDCKMKYWYIYSKTCLNQTSLGLKNLFSLDRHLVYTGSNYIRHLIDRTISLQFLLVSNLSMIFFSFCRKTWDSPASWRTSVM
jgi:hypothetical protein